MWSPQDSYRIEPPPLPRVEAGPPAGVTVVIAPHPDDETFGMGGAIAMHVAQGDAVDVICVTDGSGGDPDGHYADVDYPALRRAEAREAAAVFGLRAYDFYGYPDQYPTVTDAALESIASRISADLVAREAENVYFPWVGECHPDHHAAAMTTLRAAKGAPGVKRWIGYEVWSAMVPDYVIDVTAHRATKIAAAECFVSQLRYTPYIPVTDGLMTYRSLPLRRRTGEAPRYAEAFVEYRP